MTAKNLYTRRVSSEEEQEGYFLVFKDKLSFFPSQGRPFDLIVNGKSRKATVESYPCKCRGPELPHEHYFILCSELKQGQKVIVTKNPDYANQYSMSVE